MPGPWRIHPLAQWATVTPGRGIGVDPRIKGSSRPMPGRGLGEMGRATDPIRAAGMAPDPRTMATNRGFWNPVAGRNLNNLNNAPVLPSGAAGPEGRRWGRAALLAALLGGGIGAGALLGGDDEAALQAQEPPPGDPTVMAGPSVAGDEDPDASQALAMALLLRMINEGRQRQNDIQQFGYVKTPRPPITFE